MKKNNSLIINLIAIILILSSLFFASYQIKNKLKNDNLPNNGKEIASNSNSIDSVQKSPQKTNLRQKKDGVTIEIENIQKINSQTILTIAMSNHAYDLSKTDIVTLSSLNEVKPTDYQIENTQMGGHHVTAKITFPEELSGSLTIGLREDLIFNFDLL